VTHTIFGAAGCPSWTRIEPCALCRSHSFDGSLRKFESSGWRHNDGIRRFVDRFNVAFSSRLPCLLIVKPIGADRGRGHPQESTVEP
jgi:hypothetical protein